MALGAWQRQSSPEDAGHRHAKAPGAWRSPKRSSVLQQAGKYEASWAAVVIYRFSEGVAPGPNASAALTDPATGSLLVLYCSSIFPRFVLDLSHFLLNTPKAGLR